MPTFMFWNLAKRVPPDLVAAACKEHDVDILVLAEATNSTGEILRELNSGGEYRFTEFIRIKAPYVRFFLRLPPHSIEAVFDDSRISIRKIRPPLGIELLLIACHLPSKL